jgi:uncharacterized protein YqfA (UPF0365 family)
VAAEQYGVYAPGNPEGGKADFEAMSRDAADSMIQYPGEIFPKDLIGQEINMRGGSKAMVGMNNAGAEEMLKQLVTKASDAMSGAMPGATMGGNRRATRKGKNNMARKTVRGGKRALSKALKSWNKAVMDVYREMKKKNKDIKLKDAMKEAKRRKDRGEL